MKPNNPLTVNSPNEINCAFNAFWSNRFDKVFNYYKGRIVNNTQFLAEGSREYINRFTNGQQPCLTEGDIN